jgi:hypothetical protein
MAVRLHIEHATATRIGDVMAVVGEWAAVAALFAVAIALAGALGTFTFLYLLGAIR